jgi:hypothetical protein
LWNESRLACSRVQTFEIQKTSTVPLYPPICIAQDGCRPENTSAMRNVTLLRLTACLLKLHDEIRFMRVLPDSASPMLALFPRKSVTETFACNDLYITLVCVKINVNVFFDL